MTIAPAKELYGQVHECNDGISPGNSRFGGRISAVKTSNKQHKAVDTHPSLSVQPEKLCTSQPLTNRNTFKWQNHFETNIMLLKKHH